MNNHPTQVNKDGTLRPMYPNASHFTSWPYVGSFKVGGQDGDLYYNTQPSTGDLLIGFQTSEEGGDYLSPHLEGNALSKYYVQESKTGHGDRLRGIHFLYVKVCEHIGIQPTYTER